jgi:hypothetical protein
MKSKIKNYSIGVIIALSGSLIQPANSQAIADSVIMSAMRDELIRNYTELTANKTEKPFFISYTIANIHNTMVSATLGALNASGEQDYKDWQVRVMMGDYDITDENFSSDQPDEMVLRPRIEMPVENDYTGIRRSLWLTTNDVFNSAARTYKNKMALIAHKELGDSALEIPDFSHAPVVKMKLADSSSNADIHVMEQKAREFSELFNEYPDIYSSVITFSNFRATVYFINSEGTEVQFPFNVTSLLVQAGTMSDDSERLNKSLSYLVRNVNDLPDDADIKADIHKLIDNLLTLRTAERFNDDYTGPVLMIGQTAAESLEKFLFSGSDALIAYRETLESSNQMNMYYEHNDNSLQAKINKLVVSKDLTVSAQPFLTEYNGVPLLGHYTVDAEGVVPPQKLVLIDNGIMKTLLNGRTPSRYVPESNGHMRFDYNFRGLTNQVGPGVIVIKSNTTHAVGELKNELIKQTKELGLDYAIIIRSLDVGSSDKPFNYFKVNVADGSETMIRSARLKGMSLQTLRRSPLFSDKLMIHNTLLTTGNSNGKGMSGIPSSFILPDAMLLEDVEVESFRKPLTSMLPIIDNPVGKENPDQKTIKEDGN